MREGYEILIYGDPKDVPMLLFQRLYEQMFRELNRRHLIDSDLGPQICDDNVVRARITWDSEYDGHVPLLVVDGREISWREFSRMLMTYEGWNFKLDIFDTGSRMGLCCS